MTHDPNDWNPIAPGAGRARAQAGGHWPSRQARPADHAPAITHGFSYSNEGENEMMTEYAGAMAAQALGGQQDRPEPELGRLKAAAERVALAANRIESFLGRFGGPSGGGSEATAPQPAESYRNDIACLFSQIDRLNEAVNALEHIG